MTIGFDAVHQCLRNLFPQVDAHILNAVAIERAKDKDPDTALNYILNEVLPYIPPKKISTLTAPDYFYSDYFTSDCLSDQGEEKKQRSSGSKSRSIKIVDKDVALENKECEDTKSGVKAEVENSEALLESDLLSEYEFVENPSGSDFSNIKSKQDCADNEVNKVKDESTTNAMNPDQFLTYLSKSRLPSIIGLKRKLKLGRKRT